ncbi:cytochrome c oxidase subunit II [Acidimicrobium ferrooxidans]|nr:cytochrome c oxidase subunit II [Acidimicrobium ferrooxidans]
MSRRSITNRRRWRRRLRGPAVVAAAGTVLAACKLPTFGAYTGNTVQGNATFHLWQGFFVASIFVGGITFALLIYAIIRFRRRGDAIPKQVHGNTPLEIFYTAVPILIVAVLFFFTVRVENKVDAVAKKPALRVDVTAFQWGWKFVYPSYHVTEITQGPTGYPTLVLPVGETSTFRLVSNDVVHGFDLPNFDFSRYALPGVVNYFDFTPQHDASFVGRCSHLCGLYHADMLFYVKVVSASQFMTWIHQQQGRASA